MDKNLFSNKIINFIVLMIDLVDVIQKWMGYLKRFIADDANDPCVYDKCVWDQWVWVVRLWFSKKSPLDTQRIDVAEFVSSNILWSNLSHPSFVKLLISFLHIIHDIGWINSSEWRELADTLETGSNEWWNMKFQTPMKCLHPIQPIKLDNWM